MKRWEESVASKVQPCPLLWPTGPTQHSGLQHWPGGSLLSLDLTGAYKGVKISELGFK